MIVALHFLKCSDSLRFTISVRYLGISQLHTLFCAHTQIGRYFQLYNNEGEMGKVMAITLLDPICNAMNGTISPKRSRSYGT